MVDDDHRVDHDYFRAIAEAADRLPETTMFCGKILPDWTGDEPAWVHDLSAYAISTLRYRSTTSGKNRFASAKQGALRAAATW